MERFNIDLRLVGLLILKLIKVRESSAKSEWMEEVLKVKRKGMK